MSSTTFAIAAPAASVYFRGLAVAPVTCVPGSESAYVTAGNPANGTGAMGIVRARDAKQAAPPRGELR